MTVRSTLSRKRNKYEGREKIAIIVLVNKSLKQSLSIIKSRKPKMKIID
ncbi:hypothetical protein [Dokdonia sp. R86516]